MFYFFYFTDEESAFFNLVLARRLHKAATILWRFKQPYNFFKLLRNCGPHNYVKVQVSCASSPFRGLHVLALSRDCFLAPSHLLTKATFKETIRTIENKLQDECQTRQLNTSKSNSRNSSSKLPLPSKL